MADGCSFRKPKGDGDDGYANRKGKYPMDNFELEESDVFEIKVKTDTNRMISLEVKGSNDVELVFNEKVLENNNTLANLPIKKHSTLALMCKLVEKMEIFVKTRIGKIITLLVEPTYTIDEVKQKILHVEGIQWGEVLIFNEMVLLDSATLFDLHIRKNSTLTIMHKSRGSMHKSRGSMEIIIKIFVKILTGDQTITLKVKSSETIHNIKVKIQDKVDIPCDEQQLLFDKMFLEDTDILAACNINTGSTLTLMRILTGYMHIFIKTRTGKTITLKVKPSDTIRNLKSMIHEKEQILPSQQILDFNGRRLINNNLSLANYHIHNESTLHLKLDTIKGRIYIDDAILEQLSKHIL